jgi:AcrR family transcriptional regulator
VSTAPESPRRSQARGRATRERLLRAAGALFRRHGVAGTCVGDGARRAGVGVGTVYHHFPDKHALVLALVDDWVERVEARRRSDFDLDRFLGADPRAAVRRWLRRAYDRERKEPSVYTLVLALAERDPQVRERYERVERTATARLREIVERGQERGFVRRELDAASAAFLIHHAIDMAATRLLVREEPEPTAERVLETLADMIARTLLEDPR